MKLTKIIFIGLLFFSFATNAPAITNSISGKDLKSKIIADLNSKGVDSEPAIDVKRTFTGCMKKDIQIDKRDSSWKTLKLTCKTNKYWRFHFRNKGVNKINSYKTVETIEKKDGKEFSDQKALVLVVTKLKRKDEVLLEDDIKLELRNKMLLKETFSEKKFVLGKKLKRSLKKGAILKKKHLKPDWLVHKNQKIQIENQVGSIRVTMQGLALSNGLRGDRILAKNLSSNKTVEGFVKSEKKISIFRKIY